MGNAIESYTVGVEGGTPAASGTRLPPDRAAIDSLYERYQNVYGRPRPEALGG
jgi:hypothetical protein